MFLVIIHELGHFWAAKKSGVKVIEFGIGIPPKAYKLWTDKSGTEYTLNRLPLGGFVRLKGEDPKNPEEFKAKDSLITAKVRKKIIIMIAGVFVNFVFAWILFTTIFTVGTKPISIIPENALFVETESYLVTTLSFLDQKGLISGDIQESNAIIQETTPGMLGEELGIQSGDIITKINQDNINSQNIGKKLQENIGKEFDITYQRGEEIIQNRGTCGIDSCLLGVTIISSSNIDIKDIKFPLKESIKLGLKEIQAQTNLSLSVLGRLGKNLVSFNGTKIKESINKLSGPVGAVKFGERLLDNKDRMGYLGFAGMISLALAIFNVLPIPALDGGRILGTLIQRIGRFKAEKYFNIEGYINLVFFILLMGLGVYIILKDLIVFRGVKIPFI
ncbi:site-2 protease family protein [Candidatus Gracilibacteria bacterium]|nr:site-2 protease family protein [Candidatus Gracilibacteria bacterium]